ncbi:hypothetical protein P7D22_20370 [Lichenihabitans sp. Uapishka_5]|uniref:hypothetical protein n=1 Tax=Lichenihabitans sp. Uapishka_5 TaxID=3037302 RepID=UPI0029E7EE59|nr:hypothetical protein [Lichenihabitans sp. Uapishka_5]MDX7953524.1 hypothetical protein [Lichenihabitans sp. Uapishka_5]
MATESMRSNQQVQAPQSDARFITGWFTQQIEAGIQPEYGYPTNHLPETDTNAAIELVTGFVECCQGK